MSERALKRILLAAALLVAVYGGWKLLPALGIGGEKDTDAVETVLAGVDSSRVEAVHFTRAGDTVRLRRGADGRWLVEGYRADPNLVTHFWRQVERTRSAGVVARNPANHGRLGVDADSAVRVTFRQAGGESPTLLVGAPGPTYPSTYARLPGSDPVFLLHGSLREAARRDVAGWRDRALARVDTSRVARIEALHEEGAYTLRRSEEGWTLDGRRADGPAVRRMLGRIAILDATGFAPDTASVAGEPVRRLLVLASGRDTLAALAFHPGPEPPGGGLPPYHVTVEGREELFELSDYQADRAVPPPSELLPEDDPETREEGDGA